MKHEIFTVFNGLWSDNADQMSLLYSSSRSLKTDFTRCRLAGNVTRSTGKRTTRGAIDDGVNSVLTDEERASRILDHLASLSDSEKATVYTAHMTTLSDEDALAMAQENDYDLFVLDIMLPGMDGYELCRRLRTKTSAPVLFLSARDSELVMVVGLEIGGDD